MRVHQKEIRKWDQESYYQEKTDVDDKDDVIRFQMREHAFGSRIHVDI